MRRNSTVHAGVRTVCAACLILFASSACGRDGESTARRAATVRDSADIEIVENYDPVWTEETRWSIDSVPSLTIGVEEGDPMLEFYRLSTVRQLEDGRIVAMNAGTNELRYFSSDGTYMCSSGRRGAGPGDFENMGWLQVLGGDTLIVYSSGGGPRLSLIDPEGVFRRTLSVPRVDDVQFAQPHGFLSKRVLVMRSSRAYTPDNVTSGTHRDSSILILVAEGGSEIARIGPVPNFEAAVVRTETSMTVTGLIFGKSLVLGYGQGRLYLGTNQSYEIAEYDTLAQLRRLIRLERQPEPVTADHIARAESSRLADAESDAERASARALMDQMEFPSTMPFYNSMLVDSEGNLWVRRYAYFSTAGTWDLFDPEGQLLGEVLTPGNFRPNVITSQEMLGIARDELGVERIQKFEIIKPGEPRADGSNASEGAGPSDAEPGVYRRCGTPA